jgi:hypothetical protein
LALHRSSRRLYVMQRFTNTITTVDTRARAAVATIGVAGPRAYDPSPADVRDGRRILYDAQLSSGHGDLACATCHVFGNFDGLAWDLGDPQGAFIPFSETPWLTQLSTPHQGFDPMKGPMVTQTLRGLRGQEPFHWRGDRRNFQHFNGAFVSLMGRATPLSDEEMEAFTRFAMTIEFPPNPNRLPDDSLPATIAGHGNPSIGESFFLNERVRPDVNFRCVSCHAQPFGTNHHIQPAGDESIEVAQLRNVYELLGRDRFGTSTEPDLYRKGGFGIMHHGRFELSFFLSFSTPTLGTRLLDLTAFLVAFPTGTFPCVGHQITMQADPPPSPDSIAVLTGQAGRRRCDLIASGHLGAAAVGYAYDPNAGLWAPDSLRLPVRTSAEIVGSLQSGDVITFMGVPPGSSTRLAIDRDRDGCLDGDERAQQSDPASPGTPQADADGDGLPDAADLCPGWEQRDHRQRDTNRDGLPNECQCGDVVEDGQLDLRDVFALWRYLADPPAHPGIALEKCNVTGAAGNDPSLCTWSDWIALSRAVSPPGGPARAVALEPRCLPDPPPASPVTTTCVDAPLSALAPVSPP